MVIGGWPSILIVQGAQFFHSPFVQFFTQITPKDPEGKGSSEQGPTNGLGMAASEIVCFSGAETGSSIADTDPTSIRQIRMIRSAYFIMDIPQTRVLGISLSSG